MKHVLFLLLLLFPSISFAENITKEKASEVALSFWQSSPVSRGVSASLQLAFHSENLSSRSSGQSPAYYVFDNVSGPGFVIVAGDDVVKPVLGYSFEHEFQKDNLPSNLKAWLEDVRNDVNSLRNKNAKANSYVTKEWESVSSGMPVVKLETAQWDQGYPYNLLCPKYNDQPTYTGCVITALAIVMRYHQWPEKGTGTLPGYETYSYKIKIPDLPLGHTYDWAKMPLKFTLGYTKDEATAVSTLMRDCGIMLQADYGPVGSNGTGASTMRIPSLLSTYMGYDKNARTVSRNSYSVQEWNSMMIKELKNNRPIIYSGSNLNSGHAFVLDGYTDRLYFSVNWGWGGYCNGYFLLNALDPSGQGAGGSEGGYNNYQDAIIGITNKGDVEPVEELRFVKCWINNDTTINGLKTDDTVVSGKPFILYMGGLFNSGTSAFTGEIMVAVTDKQGNIVEELYRNNIEGLQPSYYLYNSFNVQINNPILPGYRIRGYFRSVNNQEWRIITGNKDDNCVWELLIADEFSIEETTQLTYSKKNRLLKLTVKDGVSAELRSHSGDDFSNLLNIQGNEIILDTSLLKGDSYSIILQKGDDIKKLDFSISDTEK